jgi:GTP pyrophosphokinase
LRALYDFHATYVVRPGAGTLVISNKTGDVELDIGEPKPLRWARLAEAAAFAMTIHADQLRKGSDSPYIGHLLGVASLVLEFGGDEDQAIAGLLHDAIEDQGAEQEPVIASRFGPRVAAIVRGCTDADTLPKPPWRARKEAYIAHLETAGPDIWLVSCADKLYNARAIVTDLRSLGDAMFTRFTGGKEGTLWYYRTLAEVFARVSPGILSAELGEAVGEMARLAG